MKKRFLFIVFILIFLVGFPIAVATGNMPIGLIFFAIAIVIFIMCLFSSKKKDKAITITIDKKALR